MQVTFHKDKWTEANLRKLGLNERQIKGVLHVKHEGKISNKDYQENFSVSKPTATRDLTELADKEILELRGTDKRDAHYVLARPKLSQ